MAKEQLIIELIAEAKDAIRNLKNYTEESKKSVSSIGKLTKTVKSYGAELAAIILISRKAIKIVQDLTQSYMQQEVAEAKLNAILKSTGRYSLETRDSLLAYASEMQKLTGISDDATIAATGVMATFTKIGTKTFPEALEAAMDMSKTFGQDLQQSVIQLGTALNDPIQGVGRLRRIGISFSEEQKKSIELFVAQNDLMSAQRVILDELNLEIGGVARAYGETYAGQVDILKGAFGDLKEQMGRTIVEGMKPMIPLAIKLIEKTTEWIKQKNDLREAYELLKKPMKIVNEYMQLEILQAEQLVTANEIQKKRGDIAIYQVQTQGLVNEVTKKHIGELNKEIDTMRKQYRSNAQLIDNIKKALEMREKGIPIIETETDRIRKQDAWLKKFNATFGIYIEEAYDMPVAIKEGIEAIEEQTEVLIDTKNAYEDYFILVERSIPVISAGIETQIEMFERLKKEVQETMNEIMFYTDLAYNTINLATTTSFSNRKTEADNWYQSEKDRINKTITDEEERNKQLAALDEEMEGKTKKIRRDEAKAEKNAAMFSIIINTAKGVAQSFPKFWKMAAIAAAGIIQLAIVKSQALPALQMGGQAFGDKTPVMIERGETVMDKFTAREHAAEIAAMRGGESFPSTINLVLDGRVLSSWVYKASKRGQLLIAEKSVV